MPTYEYRCKDCGEHLEVVQAFTDDALTECPACKGQLRKVFGNIGITFKGSGFHKTDSRSKKSPAKVDSKASDTTSDTSSSEKSDSKSDSKTESKSDTKSDTKKDTAPKSSPDAKTA